MKSVQTFRLAFICIIIFTIYMVVLNVSFSLFGMRAVDIHRELDLLGLSAEVHALVDDLGLDLNSVPAWFRSVLSHVNQSYKTPLPKFKYVYQPRTAHDYIQGSLFDENY